jgi:phage-related tail fiber protein
MHSWVGTDSVKRQEVNENFDSVDKMFGLITSIGEVRVATTANITLSGTQTIDGIAVVVGDRVLVKNQTSGAQNGIYDVSDGVWVRSFDADATNKIKTGIRVFVKEGTANGKQEWRMNNIGTVTLGSTSLTFDLVSGPNSGTDAVIGNRTITDTVAATSVADTITNLFSKIGFMIKAITGKANWYTAPVTSIESLNTNKANLASPALTGTPTVPTAAAGTNTTQAASTAYVQSELAADLATVAPVMDGTAAVGTSAKKAREDHRHPIDTSRAPVASPTFTGTVTLPGAPTQDLHAATKAYVDAQVATGKNYAP